MENIVLQISSASEQAIHFIWLPLVIWTVLSFTAWLILRSLPSLHPQYHYHTRLAILLALPAGLIALAALLGYSSLFLTQATAESGLKFVTFAAPPIEMILLPETTSAISILEWLYFGIALVFGAGMAYLLISLSIQWIQIGQLKKNVPFSSLQQVGNIDTVNMELAATHPRIIRAGFLEDAIVPVTFGYRKPVILLPSSLRNDSEKMNLAIRHELTHITQNDFLTHSLVLVTQLLFWYHPFIHMYKKELLDYREMRCDTLVLSGDSVSPKKYASLLLELLPMTNINKELSVNMAQESSNLKKRIQMIAQQTRNKPIPNRASLAIFTVILLSTAIAMACTDMQTQQIFDNEDINLMTDVDWDGTRGFHQIIIFMSDEEQANQNLSALDQLQNLHPGHIMSVNVLKGDTAIEHYGERGSDGVILINTNLSEESYNTVLETLGMNRMDLSLDDPYENEDIFTVVEQMPELIGGLESIQREVRYPESARQAGIEGRVYVQFVVNEEGDVVYPRVTRGIGGGADEEALRAVSLAKFRPAMQMGRPVNVHFTIPIIFRLPENERS